MSKRKNYISDIYLMYEEEITKNEKLISEIKNLKLENNLLKQENKKLKTTNENKIQKEIEKAKRPILDEKQKLENELLKAYEEINRLKLQLKNSNEDDKYLIDKLTNQVNKNSTNSGIPTSKEIKCKHKKNRSKYI